MISGRDVPICSANADENKNITQRAALSRILHPIRTEIKRVTLTSRRKRTSDQSEAADGDEFIGKSRLIA